jgi:carboxylesterase type B
VQTTGNYYIFSNIPYAEQPVGDLRFQLPVAITRNSSTINNGSTTTICVQGAPLWSIEEDAEQTGLTVEEIEEILWTEAGQTEAYLVLDVYVPASTFDTACAAKSELPRRALCDKMMLLATAVAPVLIYIHGGGFTARSKATDPAGLIARSQLDHGEGIVFVAIHYRLGLYGWLAGANDTIPNLGLHDQRRALQWVQQYISLFGGDPDRVTVMGESAGGSSIVFHVTSYGGARKLPFQRAIPQSPAFQFNINTTAGYGLTMEMASNVTGTTISAVPALNALNTTTLKTINE